MTDTTTSTDGVGFAPVPLLANSYNLAELEAAAAHAQGLKTDEGRDAAFGRMATETALLQDVVEGHANPAVPEGSVLAEVEDAQGRVVTAPVAIAAEEDADEMPKTVKRRSSTSSLATDNSGTTGNTTADQGTS